MKPRVLITRPVQQEAIDEVAKHCEVRVNAIDEPMPQQKLLEAVREVDAVMPCGLRLGGEAIAAAPNLRVVANIGAGYDNIDLDACNAARIVVTNTPDVLTEATADVAFALLLAAARRVVEGDRMVRDGRWPHWQWNCLWGAELAGKTLGLYGCGRIGQAMARRGRGFAMRVLYHSRHRLPAEIEKNLGAELVDRKTLFRESDFISIHVPSTSETRRSVGKAEISLMKPTSFLINTARGDVVDEPALIQALETKAIAGAGLDVFEKEPQVPQNLIHLSNVVLLPHIGSATAETRLRMAMLAVENLIAALQGKRPPNLVNPEVLG